MFGLRQVTIIPWASLVLEIVNIYFYSHPYLYFWLDNLKSFQLYVHMLESDRWKVIVQCPRTSNYYPLFPMTCQKLAMLECHNSLYNEPCHPPLNIICCHSTLLLVGNIPHKLHTPSEPWPCLQPSPLLPPCPPLSAQVVNTHHENIQGTRQAWSGSVLEVHDLFSGTVILQGIVPEKILNLLQSGVRDIDKNKTLHCNMAYFNGPPILHR